MDTSLSSSQNSAKRAAGTEVILEGGGGGGNGGGGNGGGGNQGGRGGGDGGGGNQGDGLGMPLHRHETVIEVTLLQQSVRVRLGLTFVLAAAVIFIPLVFLLRADPRSAAQIIGFIAGATYDARGDMQEKIETEFQFSTPTPETAAAMSERSECDLNDISFYEVTESEIRNFIEDLRYYGIQGYDFTEGKGSGKNCEKPIYVWHVNTTPDSKLDRKTLLMLYKRHFQRDRDIYIKETKLSRTLSNAADL